MSKNRSQKSRRGIRNRLLISTATAACGWTALSIPAFAEVPAECDVEGPPTEISCVVPAPITIGQVTTSDDNATVRIGTAETPTHIVEDAGDGIIMVGNDQLALVVAEGSSITSNSANGAFLSAGGSGVIFVTGQGDFTGARDGLRVFTQGSGGLSISANDITGQTGDGLVIQTLPGAGSTTLIITGKVIGAVEGVNIIDEGASGISGSFGSIEGGEYGLHIQKFTDGDVNISSDGDISSPGTAAVYMFREGEGDLNFSNSGSIIGDMNLLTRSQTGELNAILNNMTGDVRAVSDSGGSDIDVTVALSGSLQGKIFAKSVHGDITVVTQGVTDTIAGPMGVAAFSVGNGNISMITEGDVVSASDMAVVGINSGALGNIAIETGNVSTSGNAAVVAQMDVGIVGDVFMLTHGSLQAEEMGISVLHMGTGSVGIAAEGSIESGKEGIWIKQSGDGDTNINALGAIQAGTDGIFLDHDGSGDISVSTTGVITAGDDGLEIVRAGNGIIDVTTSGEINAGDIGIRSYMIGLGDMSINTSADIDAGNVGIFAFKQGQGNLSIKSANDISGNVIATKFFDGNLGIDITGDVNGSVSASADSDLSELAVSVDGNINSDDLLIAGIDVTNLSFGLTDVVVSGDVIAAANGVKISATSAGANLAVSGHVSGAGYGVDLMSAGDSSVDLNSVESDGVAIQLISEGSLEAVIHGDVTAGVDGIYFTSAGAGTNSLLMEGNVTANELGALVSNTGSGDLSIVSMGTISGAIGGMGVNDFGAGNLTVSVQDVLGTLAGMSVRQGGDGLDMNVTAIGEISTTEGFAFGAEAYGSGGKSIFLNDASSEFGSGVLVITENGTGTSLTISGTASGGQYGVAIDSTEALVLDINNAVGGTLSGVEISSGSNIDAVFRGLVTGQDRGIGASGGDGGVWNFTIAESGEVQSSMGHAIDLSGLASSGKLTLTNHGTISSGGNSASSVYLSDTTDGDTFLNTGLVDGVDIFMLSGNDSMVNEGTILGDWLGGAGADSFLNAGMLKGRVFDPDGASVVNQISGLIESAGAFDLGGETLINEGTFSSGGVGSVYTTAINGSFTQNESGSLLIDVDGQNGIADRLDFTGDANLSGIVNVNFFSPAAAQQEFLIVSTAGGTLTNSGLGLAGDMQVSPLVSVALDFRNANELYLTSLVDFTPDLADLNPNQNEIANDLDDIFAEDPDALDPLTDGLFEYVEDLTDYPGAINQLLPEIYLNTLQTTLLATREFSNEITGCTGIGTISLADGNECAKLIMEATQLERDGNNALIGFEEGTFKLQAGYFKPLNETMTFGAGLRYDSSLINSDIKSQADGDRLQIGASIIYRNGGLALAGVANAGFASYETTRRVSFGNFASHSSGEQKIYAYSSELMASYSFETQRFYAKPAVSLLATHLQSNALTETGGIGTDYSIGSTSGWYLSVEPSLEIGGDYATGSGSRVQPFLRGGFKFLADNDFRISGHFADAPNLADGFVTNSELDDTLMNVDAGLRFLFGESSALTTEYFGTYSDEIQSHGVRLRASFAF